MTKAWKGTVVSPLDGAMSNCLPAIKISQLPKQHLVQVVGCAEVIGQGVGRIGLLREVLQRGAIEACLVAPRTGVKTTAQTQEIVGELLGLQRQFYPTGAVLGDRPGVGGD